ncbi:MAG: hypothetical protein U5L75_01565 [Candidatus Campbellbacteria bacterium]|nr:hypothetical protein [Candidatus Campbellbacteria bacterium]
MARKAKFQENTKQTPKKGRKELSPTGRKVRTSYETAAKKLGRT